MNLVYTLVNYNTKDYIEMFKIFLKSLVYFSKPNFELLIITDDITKSKIQKIKEIKEIKKVHYLIVPFDNDLYHALLRKCDITEFKGFNDYDKIMYLDCDIIVQNDINKLFDIVKAQPNKLYAPAEGTLDGKYWTLNSYKKDDFERLRKNGINSFNSGTMLFKPSEQMKRHFQNVKKLALDYKGKHFYDQTFLNYYFNTNKISSTKYISDYVLLFPDVSKYYPYKTILHIAGIGRYKEKAKIMRKYLNDIIYVKAMKDVKKLEKDISELKRIREENNIISRSFSPL